MGTTVAFASVRINEIAWMGSAGTGGDTNEWIELMNDGTSAADLSGWHLSALDASPNITLSGSIPAGEYYLIERTDNASVPNIEANLVASFGKGLANGGETLELKDAAGNTVDTVVGGANWGNVGGSAKTFETAQRTQNSWITAKPTPHASNIAEAGEVLGESVVLGSPLAQNTTMQSSAILDAGEDMRTYVNFPVFLFAHAYGVKHEARSMTSPVWNFGDGAAGSGANVIHAYQFSGTYLVTLEGDVDGAHLKDRVLVTVLPAPVIIDAAKGGEDGYVRFKNNAREEIDLSGWKLRERKSLREFTFLPNSVVLSGGSFTLPARISGVNDLSMGLTLYLSSGALADDWNPNAPLVKTAALPASNISKLGTGAGLQTLDTGAKGTTSSSSLLWSRDTAALALGMLDPSTLMKKNWYLAALLFAVLLVLGYMIKRARDEKKTTNEYVIIEDIIEGPDDGVETTISK